MKVKFSSVSCMLEFSGISHANKEIAKYMGMDSHNAVNHSNGEIELLDSEGEFFELGEGWCPVIWMKERSFFDIEV